MVESRCGLLCSECKWKEIMKCGGCMAIKKPFWGPKCPIKTCCEDRGKAHCGQAVFAPQAVSPLVAEHARRIA